MPTMEIIFPVMKAAVILAAVLTPAYSFAVVDLKKALKFSAALGLFGVSIAFFGVENFFGFSEANINIIKHAFVYAGMIFFYLFLVDCLSSHCPKLTESG